MITVLKGHESPETAYVVADYPYGFRLRCQIRFWIETKRGRGARVVSQTTNPKRGGVRVEGNTLVKDDSVVVWNKPKASTYSDIRVLFLDEKGHVQNDALSIHASTEKVVAFEAAYSEAFTSRDKAVLSALKSLAADVDAREAARKAAIDKPTDL